MLDDLREDKKTQLILGFLAGICFGFLLQKGGATDYDVIMGQLLLYDWTVFKIMMTVVVVGMIGIHVMRRLGWVTLHLKPGSLGSTLVGGLIFGVGFAILGYCPGTLAGACGHGALDALLGGVPGMLLGAAFYAAIYPALRDRVLNKGDFGEKTIPELLGVNRWLVIVILCPLILFVFWLLEQWNL